MEIKITRDESKDLTMFDVTGLASDEELLHTLETYYEREPTALVLWDLSQADFSRISTKAVKAFIQRTAVFGLQREGGRTAVFAPLDLQFGLSRMSEVFAEETFAPFDLRVFRSREEALEWLLAESNSE